MGSYAAIARQDMPSASPSFPGALQRASSSTPTSPSLRSRAQTSTRLARSSLESWVRSRLMTTALCGSPEPCGYTWKNAQARLVPPTVWVCTQTRSRTGFERSRTFWGTRWIRGSQSSWWRYGSRHWYVAVTQAAGSTETKGSGMRMSPNRGRPGRRSRVWRVAHWAVQPRIRTFLVLGIVGVPLLVALVASQLLPSFLWFRELGQEDVFVRVQEVKLLLLVIVGGLTGSFLLGNAWLAIRHAPFSLSLRSIPTVIWGTTLIAAILGWSARGGWQAALLWVHRQPFGIEDPLHHRDV